jgi:hypothetical protein
MSSTALQEVYQRASNPALPSSEVYDLTDFWLSTGRRLGAIAAIQAALASNPANTLLGLMRLYPYFPALVRDNPALPLLVLEKPENYRIGRAMSLPMYELYQQMEVLFNSDGRRPPSTTVTNRVQQLMSNGYTEEDVQALQTILRADPNYYSNRSSSFMDQLWGYWLWVSEWRIAQIAPGEPGFFVAYFIGKREGLSTLHEPTDDLLPEMAYSTGDTTIYHSIVNSPHGNFPILFSSEESAKRNLPCVRKRLRLVAKDVGIFPLRVRLDEVQPLVNLGGLTAACDDFTGHTRHGALRKLLTAERIMFPPAKGKKRPRQPKEKVGGVRVLLGLIAEVKTNMPDADFWLMRVGSEATVGTPVRKFAADYIGIRITMRNLLHEDWLFHALTFLQKQGHWKAVATGTTNRKSIRTEDVKNLAFTM